MSRSAALHLRRHTARGRPHKPEYRSRDVKKINDPESVDNDSVYTLDSFGLIGLDLWQLKGGTIFDHIIITDDKVKADTFTISRRTLISTVISISKGMYKLMCLPDVVFCGRCWRHQYSTITHLYMWLSLQNGSLQK